MSPMRFAAGMALGVMVGAAVGMLMSPKKRRRNKLIGRALKAAGEVMDTVTSTIMC